MIEFPFNKPFVTGKETSYILDAIAQAHLSGDGPYTRACHEWLEKNLPVEAALLTHSCTAALEMAALLLDASPGDEVIMPSYTFVSTANAFVLRGMVPVFIDIRNDTFNIDETLIEAAITPKTKAIVVVHYAGVACEMDTISALAKKHGLVLIEDAAQGMMASYKGKALGTLSDFGAFSFHETKNVHCGEGGALLMRSPEHIERAEIIRQKGTNRAKFFRGEVDKYTWVDVGSSYLASDILAAFLLAQFEEAGNITRERMKIWNRYHQAFEPLEKAGALRRPIIPGHCEHNAHMYYLVVPDSVDRGAVLEKLRAKDVCAIFHYIPLHSSPAGQKYGRTSGELTVTERISEKIVRLPLWPGIREDQIQRVVGAVEEVFRPFARRSMDPRPVTITADNPGIV